MYEILLAKKISGKIIHQLQIANRNETQNTTVRLYTSCQAN